MKPWVSLGQDDKASTSVGKERKKSRSELKGHSAHLDLSPEEAGESQHFLWTGPVTHMDAQTWSQPTLLFSLPRSPFYSPPSLAFAGSQITAFFQKQTQSRWYAGPLSQMASQILSKWRVAFKKEGCAVNSLL